MDKKLLEILVCPQCKGALTLDNKHDVLTCARCKLAYPLRDGIPVLLAEEARPLITAKDQP